MNTKRHARRSGRADSELTGSYMITNILAAVIASYGLFADSPAVVIGAMIVAMLLGPITGIGLSLVDADMSLLASAIPTLIAGGLGVIGVAAVLGLVHRDMPITHEIMTRTTPNLVDLMIALAGGAAGAFATVSPRLNVAFVGVAIATALVPPLCAATILLVRGEYDLAGGAYLLTFTNIVGIQFANSAVLGLAGFRKAIGVQGASFGGFLHSNLVTLVLVSALGIQLTINLRKTIEQERFKSAVESKLDGFFDSSPGARLASVRFERSSSDRKLIVRRGHAWSRRSECGTSRGDGRRVAKTSEWFARAAYPFCGNSDHQPKGTGTG